MPLTDHDTRVCEKAETLLYTPRMHVLFFSPTHPVRTLLHGIVPSLFYGGYAHFLADCCTMKISEELFQFPGNHRSVTHVTQESTDRSHAFRISSDEAKVSIRFATFVFCFAIFVLFALPFATSC